MTRPSLLVRMCLAVADTPLPCTWQPDSGAFTVDIGFGPAFVDALKTACVDRGEWIFYPDLTTGQQFAEFIPYAEVTGTGWPG